MDIVMCFKINNCSFDVAISTKHELIIVIFV